MTERKDLLRDQRVAEPGAAEAYEAARLAYELGRTVRQMREARAVNAQPAEQSGDPDRGARSVQ